MSAGVPVRFLRAYTYVPHSMKYVFRRFPLGYITILIYNQGGYAREFGSQLGYRRPSYYAGIYACYF